MVGTLIQAMGKNDTDFMENHHTNYWQVVGGADSGGILVRHGCDRQSPLHEHRLATTAVVQEITVSGGRLHYMLVSGSGPEEGWVSIRSGNRALVAPLKMSEPKVARKYLSQLTSVERQAIQMDLLAEYSKYNFQEELHRAWEAANGDVSKQAKMRWAVCWNIQAPIFKQHGLAGSPQDVLQSNACIAVEDSSSEPRDIEAWMIWLIHPPAQVVHPNGPPHSATAAEMLKISMPDLVAQLPKHKVLAQVPCQRVVENMVYSVHVAGAMSGEILCTVEVAPSDRICDLKRFICKLEGTPTTEQKLLLGGRVLQCETEDVATLLRQQSSQLSNDNVESATRPQCLKLTLVRLPTERAALLKSFELGTFSLDEVQTDLREDPECVLAALKRNPVSLLHAAESLQNSREFLLVASKVRGGILQYAPQWAQEDRDIVFAAVQLEGRMLEYVCDDLRSDYQIVRAAVESDGTALEFACYTLRANADIVRAAVENAGAALEYADDLLKGHFGIAVAAITQDPEGASRHVGPELLQNFSFGARLETLGLLGYSLFARMFPETLEVARNYFSGGEAILLDAGPHDDFAKRRELPVSLLTGVHMSFEQDEFFADLLGSLQHLFIIMDEDRSPFPPSSCARLQQVLRLALKVQNFHAVRLIVGGLNRWQHLGYPLTGQTRSILMSLPQATLKRAQAWNPTA